MNMNTLYQELSKKFDNMGVEDFCLFIRRLVTMYMTKHKPNLQICVAEKINTQIHKFDKEAPKEKDDQVYADVIIQGRHEDYSWLENHIRK